MRIFPGRRLIHVNESCRERAKFADSNSGMTGGRHVVGSLFVGGRILDALDVLRAGDDDPFDGDMCRDPSVHHARRTNSSNIAPPVRAE
jgi:hypothetical protein